MPVCPRCHSEYAPPTGRCARCDVPLLEIVSGAKEPGPESRFEDESHDDTVGDDERDSEERTRQDDPLRLLLEEPIPEIAEMLGEFLKDCGIRAVVHTDTIGRLYRLPVPLSQTRIYVRASDFAEARALIHRFARPD